MNKISANASNKELFALIFICMFYLLCVLRQKSFSVGIAVGVVHRAERLAGGAGCVSVLALRLAMCYISKPKLRNNLYTKIMLI